MAQSGTQRTLKYRSLKIASEFSGKHLEGVDFTSIDEFIRAKKVEAELKHNVKLISFEDGLIKLFMANVEDIDPHKYNDNIYAVNELLKVWKISLLEVKFSQIS
jgi:hypothetical protein